MYKYSRLSYKGDLRPVSANVRHFFEKSAMQDLAPNITRQRLLIEGFFSVPVDRLTVEQFLIGIAAHLELRTYGTPIIHSPEGDGKPENAGFDAFIPLIDSGISLYVWTKRKFFAAVLFTCKTFEVTQAIEFTKTHFGCTSVEFREF
jgi:S-adenosylmethionine decarboxylase